MHGLCVVCANVEQLFFMQNFVKGASFFFGGWVIVCLAYFFMYVGPGFFRNFFVFEGGGREFVVINWEVMRNLLLIFVHSVIVNLLL